MIQARTGSRRLPGKVLMPIGGMPLLARVVDRARRSGAGGKVVVATSTAVADDAIESLAKSLAIDCFRGSEQNVLERYVECARRHGLGQVVRLTADNPFTDVEELDRLIALHLEGDFDYSHSFGQLPLGVGAEIFQADALERSLREATAPNHFEHVNDYIQENPGRFRIGMLEVPHGKRCPALRLTVDTREDYERACRLVEKAAGGEVQTRFAIEACSSSA